MFWSRVRRKLVSIYLIFIYRRNRYLVEKMIVIINAKSTSFSNTVTILQVFMYSKKVSREIFVSLSTVTDGSNKKNALLFFINVTIPYDNILSKLK